MDILKQLAKIASELSQPLRNQPDYGTNSLLDQLAEHAGIDLNSLQSPKTATIFNTGEETSALKDMDGQNIGYMLGVTASMMLSETQEPDLDVDQLDSLDTEIEAGLEQGKVDRELFSKRLACEKEIWASFDSGLKSRFGAEYDRALSGLRMH